MPRSSLYQSLKPKSQRLLSIARASTVAALLWLIVSVAAAQADAPAPTTTMVTVSASTINPGEPVIVHAFVEPTDGGGTVSFISDGTLIPGCTNLPFLSGGGTDWVANCTISSLASGSHYINAVYSGDSGYATSASASPNPAVYVADATTTSLAAAHSSTTINTMDTLTATATSNGRGTVSFIQGGVPISGCSGLPLPAVNGVYQAVCTVKWTQPGTYAVVANYSGAAGNPAFGDDGLAPSSATMTVTVTAGAAPTVSSLTPKAGPTTGGGTITITGSGFTAATGVIFGKVAAKNVSIVSDTKLTAAIPAHAAGTITVFVTSPAGQSSASANARYTYDPAPTVSAISPATGATGTMVTLTGTGFVSGSKVMFGTVSATRTTQVSKTEIEATAPTGAGGVPVTVTTPGGTSTASSADRFTYSG